MYKYLKRLEEKNYSINTLYCYKSALKEYFEKFKFRINKEDLVEYFRVISGKNGEQTVAFKKIVLCNYLRYKKSKFLKTVKELKTSTVHNKFFNTIDKKSFLKILKNISNICEKNLFNLLFYTGIRVSEIKSLKKKYNQ